MADIILGNIYLILFLPLWVFLIIMLGRFFSVYIDKRIIYCLTLLSSLLGIALSASGLYVLKSDTIFESVIPFIKIKDFIINCGLHVDKIALIFALVLFIISFAIQLFSISYMKEEKKQYKFYALLNLFNFAMTGLFFSPNLFQIYFFWEIVGVVSYILIGFDYNREEKSIASKKVFIINRIGDTAFLGGIILFSYFMYTYADNLSFSSIPFADINIISTLLYAYASTPLFIIICGLLIIGLITKSAQFPFYTWLQDAMEAKLPVSALLHSATMVALGIFLAIRLMPVFMFIPLILKIISGIGIITALICSLSACTQNNPKKVLAYSTSAQLGLMFFALGYLNIKAAVIYFIAHAFIKSLMFITLPKENDTWKCGNFVCFVLSGLSLSGLIFSGLIAKELLIMGSEKILIVIAIIAFLTAFYVTRVTVIMVKKHGLHRNNMKFYQFLPAFILLSLNIVFYVYLRIHMAYKIEWVSVVSLASIIVACVYYLKNFNFKIPLLYQLCLNGFYLDKLYVNIFAKVYGQICKLLDLIDIYVFSNYKPIISTAKAGVKITDFIENKVMNKSVDIIKNVSKWASKEEIRYQTGNIQRYNTYAFVIITAIISCLIITYTTILIYMGS